jgi:drug/metabolite transporter (DMT)-like permease
MLYLIASILFSASILILFRYFKKFGIDNLQAIIANYFLASVIGFVAYENDYTLNEIYSASWFSMAVLLGFIFIGVFFLFALSSQKAGVAVTAVASRMSVVIPVAGGFLLFGEQAGTMKLIGIALALPAFYLTFKKKQSVKVSLALAILPILIFLGTGTNDLLMKYTDHHYLKDDLYLLLATIFIFAMTIGILVLLYRLYNKQTVLSWKHFLAGLLLGLVNFGSTYYMFRSMTVFESSVMFPVLNTGVVSIAALADYFLFGEKLSRTNWIGILLALIAIVFISMY